MRNKERKDLLGEVFTPLEIIQEMISYLPADVWTLDKTFCDNSCGNGNFLVAILERKLKLGHDPLTALSTLCGVDIMQDNIDECQERLLTMLPAGTDLVEAKRIVMHNIVCHDALTFDWDAFELQKPRQVEPKKKFVFGFSKDSK